MFPRWDYEYGTRLFLPVTTILLLTMSCLYCCASSVCKYRQFSESIPVLTMFYVHRRQVFEVQCYAVISNQYCTGHNSWTTSGGSQDTNGRKPFANHGTVFQGGLVSWRCSRSLPGSYSMGQSARKYAYFRMLMNEHRRGLKHPPRVPFLFSLPRRLRTVARKLA